MARTHLVQGQLGWGLDTAGKLKAGFRWFLDISLYKGLLLALAATSGKLGLVPRCTTENRKTDDTELFIAKPQIYNYDKSAGHVALLVGLYSGWNCLKLWELAT